VQLRLATRTSCLHSQLVLNNLLLLLDLHDHCLLFEDEQLLQFFLLLLNEHEGLRVLLKLHLV
jgi:hypothetical protein